MSLDNLVQKTGDLHPQPPDRDAIRRLLKAADASLKDARNKSLEPENQFDLAYKTIMRAAMAALWANGYRTSTNKPGHHAIVIQVLRLTIGYDPQRTNVLDALRRKRNGIDYDADIVSAQMVASCIDEAAALLASVRKWITVNRPGLDDS